MRNLIEARIRQLRIQAIKTAWQHTFIDPAVHERVAVDPAQSFDFHPQAYAPSRDYDGRFYPDFLCQLPDGVVLAVEYKGAGRCRFVMVKDKAGTPSTNGSSERACFEPLIRRRLASESGDRDG
jgi:hypothetical protein